MAIDSRAGASFSRLFRLERDPILSAALAFSGAMLVIEVWAGFAFSSSSLHASALDFLADTALYVTSLSGVGLWVRARARAALFAWAVTLLAGIAVLASAIYHYVEVATPHGRAMTIIGLLAFVADGVVAMGLRRSRVPEVAHDRDTAEIGNLIAVAAAALVCTAGSRWPDLAGGWIVGGFAITTAWQGMRLANTELRVALLSGAGIVLHAASVEAHAIAGNRLFPGTLTFDDPAVLDEMDLPFISSALVPQPLERSQARH